MSSQHILHILLSFLPFLVCLFWLICFVEQFRKTDGAKRVLTAYLAACVVLYLCHALYFTVGLPLALECLWTFCSLSVYPLFYGYICRLTSSDFRVQSLLPWLLPGAIVAAAKYAFPNAGLDNVRLLLFAVQICMVCYFGIRKLKAFDLRLHAVYADPEKRDTTAVHHLLVAVIIVSVLSGVANSVGKHFFGESLWLLMAVSLAFSTMQFALSYIGFCRNFTIDQLDLDENLPCPSSSSTSPDLSEEGENGSGEIIGQKIEALMKERHYFLKKDLKISDVAKEIGSNRTYVSNYINATYHCSFSDYMNRLRIEHAKTLLASAPKGTKLMQIAEESGYASEQSFYRNFKKFTGATPADWQRSPSTSPIPPTTSPNPSANKTADGSSEGRENGAGEDAPRARE